MCGAEIADASRRFCGGDTCDEVLLPRDDRDSAVRLGRALALALILLASLAVAGAADGQVPTAADITACNEEAPRAMKAGSASPTGGDQARADTARGATSSTTSAPVAPALPGVVESSDPQIHGMQRAGAGNAAYQAAYRSCMRRKGF
jgi:predicted nucleic acid-binding Zn ribbon protein